MMGRLSRRCTGYKAFERRDLAHLRYAALHTDIVKTVTLASKRTEKGAYRPRVVP